MGFSSYTCERALQEIRDQSWVSLHFDNPEIAGALTSEITGSGYVRKRAVFGDIANKTMWVVEAVAWQGLPQTRVLFLAGFDARFAGNLQWSCPLDKPARIIEGKGYSIQSNTIVLSFT